MSTTLPAIAPRSWLGRYLVAGLERGFRPSRAGAINPRPYRPEIDGLRAIAVGMVVLFHAQFGMGGIDPFSGGFIGVDIFLVISGYLIGLILLREIDERRFSLIRFYERRARRILPALYVVLLATIPLAWLLLLPAALKAYGGGLTSAVTSVSNIYFWREVDYDAADNLANPLIHTWSLGLEEQFYLLFPALLLLVARYRRQWMIPMLWALCVASIVLAEIMTARAPDDSFFLLPSRIWELGAGALLAAYELRDGGAPSSRIAPIIGMGAILASLPLMPLNQHHPGLFTLIPVAGTAMIIRYGGRNDPVGRLLSSRALVAVGLISYSLYLWHQPVLVFSRLWRVDEPGPLAKLGWILLAAALATATYRLVEKPTRDRALVAPKAIWAVSIGGALMIGATGLALFLYRGVPSRFDGRLQAIARAEVIDEAAIFQGRKGCMNYVPEDGPCHFRTGHPDGYNLMLVGDSHARLLSGPLIDRLGQSPSLSSIALLNRGGCLFLPGLVRVDGTTAACPASYDRARLRYLGTQPHAVVVLMMRLPIVVERSRFDNGAGGVEQGDPPHISAAAGPYDVPVGEADIRHHLVDTVRALLAHGARVVLVYPVPEMGWNIPNKLFQLARDDPSGVWMEEIQASVSRHQFRVRSQRSNKMLDAVGEHRNLARVYPERIFCHRLRCLSHDRTSVFYRDDNHLSRAGADRLADEILRTIDREWGITIRPANFRTAAVPP